MDMHKLLRIMRKADAVDKNIVEAINKKQKIHTELVDKGPLGQEWAATFDGYDGAPDAPEETSIIGWGKTEKDATNDLLWQADEFNSSEYQDDLDDGQPSEYEEYQDYMGGDDWDHGQYDENIDEGNHSFDHFIPGDDGEEDLCTITYEVSNGKVIPQSIHAESEGQNPSARLYGTDIDIQADEHLWKELTLAAQDDYDYNTKLGEGQNARDSERKDYGKKDVRKSEGNKKRRENDKKTVKENYGCTASDSGMTEEQVSFTQTKNQGSASVTVSANADSMEELQAMLHLAGIALPNAPADAATAQEIVVVAPQAQAAPEQSSEKAAIIDQLQKSLSQKFNL